MRRELLILSFVSLGVLQAHASKSKKGANEAETEQTAAPFRGVISEEDAIPWRFERTGRLVIISDLHGDVDALLSILLEAKLIEIKNDNIEWIGGKNLQLVVMGDAVAKGDESGHILNLLMHLEKLMHENGSEMHFILGNHEKKLLMGDYSKLSPKDLEYFEKMGDIRELFSKQGIFGNWLAQKNAIIQIGEYVFCHKGLGEWVHRFSIGQINTTLRQWIDFWISGGDRPPLLTAWVAGIDFLSKRSYEGPLESRALAPGKMDVKASEFITPFSLSTWLRTIGAKMVFIAHYALPQLVGYHPIFGESVWLTDTGISRALPKGRVTYIDLAAGEDIKTAIEVARSPHPHPARKSGCLKKLRTNLKGKKEDS